MNTQGNRRPEDEDVEGHRPRAADAEASGDEDVEGHRPRAADAEASGDEDVEGHRITLK